MGKLTSVAIEETLCNWRKGDVTATNTVQYNAVVHCLLSLHEQTVNFLICNNVYLGISMCNSFPK